MIGTLTAPTCSAATPACAEAAILVTDSPANAADVDRSWIDPLRSIEKIITMSFIVSKQNLIQLFSVSAKQYTLK